ncbi:DUF3348 family protein [Luteimonas aestuarii]|nr:DUF3348 family protein [Luteimonas aestuarii]
MASRLSDVAHAEAGASLSQRLGEWLDWRRAVALARVLDTAVAPGPGTGRAEASASSSPPVEDESRQARESFARAIDALDLPADAAGIDDAAPLIRQYIELQRRLQAGTGRLRDRTRECVRSQSADMAQLAELDVVMEGLLSPREQALLDGIPTLLANHAARLRGDGAGPQSETDPPRDTDAIPVSLPASAGSDWPTTFLRDLRDLLHAELDVRFQPIEGLLAALRQHGPLTP